LTGSRPGARVDLPNGIRWQIQADIYNIINAGPAINGLNTFAFQSAIEN